MRTLRQGLQIVIALQLALAPAAVVAQDTSGGQWVSADQVQLTGAEPEAIQDVTEFQDDDGNVHKQVITVIKVANEHQNEQALEWLRENAEQAVRDSEEHGSTVDMVTSVEEGPRGEQIIAEIESVLPEKVKNEHLVVRLSKKVKQTLVNVMEKVRGAGRFIRDEVRIETYPMAHFVGFIRSSMNAKVLSTVFFATYLGHPGLGTELPVPQWIKDHTFDWIKNGLSSLSFTDGYIGTGPAWVAAIAAATLSYLMTVLKRKSTDKNLFSEWLTSEPSGPITAYFDKALAWAKVSDEKRQKIVNELSTLKRWTWSDAYFLGTMVTVLYAYGYPLSNSLLGFATGFASSVMAGVASQWNLDVYLAKFQDWVYLVSKEGSIKRAIGKFFYFLQMLAFSVLSTGATAMTFGSGKTWGWIATGVLFSTGFGLNFAQTRFLNKAISRNRAIEEAAKKAAELGNVRAAEVNPTCEDLINAPAVGEDLRQTGS